MFLFFQVDTCHDLFPKAKAQSVVGLVTRAVDKVLVISSRALSSSFVVGASAHDLFFLPRGGAVTAKLNAPRLVHWLKQALHALNAGHH